MNPPIHVRSEIGKLKTVVLKRPCLEIEMLTPEYLTELLFDDIPFLPTMREEHDAFAKALTDQDIEVLYLEKLMTEAVKTEAQREAFVDSLLGESTYLAGYTSDKVKEYLLSFPTEQMIAKTMSGIRTCEVNMPREKTLLALTLDYPFYLPPMPNLYFTRDPAVSIGNGISFSRMKEPARRQESLYMDFIIKNHDRFKDANIPAWFDRDFRYSIEGGDILILSKEAIAIGISARTTAAAIEHIAKSLFAANSDVKKVLAIDIPKRRAFMHLDTVFTMVDHNVFSVHPEILDKHGETDTYILEKGDCPDTLCITKLRDVKEALKSVLHLDEIEFIPCAGGDIIAAPREQWTDGSNTLAVAPGVVVTYDRNCITNRIFRERGIEVIEIPSAELSRGRGGPRCMSMPLVREDI